MSTISKVAFHCSRRVEFADTDAAGIVHFSSYFRYMEFAEAAFFRSHGWPLLEEREGGAFGFPRVNTKARFKAPLFFDEEVHIELSIRELERARIHYEFRFLKDSKDGRQTVATGEMTVVYVKRDSPGQKLVPVDIPTQYRDQLIALKTQ